MGFFEFMLLGGNPIGLFLNFAGNEEQKQDERRRREEAEKKRREEDEINTNRG